jgi:hypothetical protein
MYSRHSETTAVEVYFWASTGGARGRGCRNVSEALEKSQPEGGWPKETPNKKGREK